MTYYPDTASLLKGCWWVIALLPWDGTETTRSKHLTKGLHTFFFFCLFIYSTLQNSLNLSVSAPQILTVCVSWMTGNQTTLLSCEVSLSLKQTVVPVFNVQFFLSVMRAPGLIWSCSLFCPPECWGSTHLSIIGKSCAAGSGSKPLNVARFRVSVRGSQLSELQPLPPH